MSVRAYKALDYPMKLYGFWPGDLASVFLVFLLVHGAFDRPLVDCVVVGPLLYVAWRGRKRPALYVSSLLAFVSRPRRYAVGAASERIGR